MEEVLKQDREIEKVFENCKRGLCVETKHGNDTWESRCARNCTGRWRAIAERQNWPEPFTWQRLEKDNSSWTGFATI